MTSPDWGPHLFVEKLCQASLNDTPTERAIMARLPLIAAFGALLPTVATAQGFDGAYISIETLQYPSEGDAGQMSYSGGAQFTFGPGFGVSADLTSYGFELLSGNATSGTLHAFYNTSPVSAVGAFYGFDSYEDTDRTFYGAEGQIGIAGTTVEGFLGKSEGDFAEGTMYGVAGEYGFGSFGVTADYAAFEGSGQTFDRYAFGGVWRLSAGPTLYAEYGQRRGDIDEELVSVGVRIGIGPNAGTTFGSRSAVEIVPGF